MQPVHQNREKLVRVLLIHATEDLFALADHPAQIVAGDVPMLVQPYLPYHGVKLFCNRSLRPAVAVELLFAVAVVGEEKILERRRVAQALHDAVHVACVAEIL